MIAVFTTIERGAAENFAKKLVENRLAACVSMLPEIKSAYRWNGAIEVAEETLLMIKTDIEKLPDIKKFFANNHTYELPEFAYVNCEGEEGYINWILESVKTNI